MKVMLKIPHKKVLKIRKNVHEDSTVSVFGLVLCKKDLTNMCYFQQF